MHANFDPPAARRGRAAGPAPVRRARRDGRSEADFRQGLECSRKGQWDQAAKAFARAAGRCPEDAVFWLNLAHARVKLGELEGAVEAARRAIALDPDSEQAVAIATQCFSAANRHAEVVELLHGRDLGGATTPLLHYCLGVALFGLSRCQDSVPALLAALQRQPHFLPGHVQLANVFERMKLHLEARECFQTAIAVGGDRIELLAAMAYQSLQACRWDLAAQDHEALRAALESGQGRAAPFHFLALPTTRAQQRIAGHAYWAERYGTTRPMPPPGPRRPGARVRLGYMSNDFFRHATAYLIAEVLERHDRTRFEVYVYSYGHDDGSEMRRRIERAGDSFFDAAAVSDAALAERIRSDDIDVLVDLKGYTLGSRIRVPTLHPARVQVNYLGFPGTSGAPCYEYVVGDPFVTPLEHAADYSEKIAQLPHCYQPNDRQRAIGPRPGRTECGLPQRGFVFCCFNNAFKITAPVFDRWCRLLRQVEGSVLWLYEASSQARQGLLAEAARRGVAAERLVWAPHVALEQHLGRLQLADLVLDTWPYNAHTTASDALWAGVPVVTTPGETFVSRVAGSILHAAGMAELVAPDADSYERLALELARDPQRLAALRARLGQERERCPLFDSERYARDLESLYLRMMAGWAKEAPPRHLPARAADAAPAAGSTLAWEETTS
jgi:tetratricopeptide (TPR) repeat protein